MQGLITFIQQFINGLSLGSVYALMALGYTMVYGIAKMLNFAHGDIIMVGAYTVSVVCTTMGLSPVIAVIASAVICTVLGVTIEKIAYKPLRSASPLAVLITAIGVSFFLQSVALLIFGSNAKKVPPVVSINSIKVGNVDLSGIAVIVIGVTILIMIGLSLFINCTKIGKAMLAVSEDKGAAELMGINVNATISLTFAIGSALAAVACVLFVSSYGYVDPYTGALPGIKAFVAAVLGGIGSIPGAMLGGVILGVIESLSKAYISTNLSDAIVFGVLIVVLLVKPTGILGKKKITKV